MEVDESRWEYVEMFFIYWSMYVRVNKSFYVLVDGRFRKIRC